MGSGLDDAREHFIQGVSRIAHFWGFPKGMGAIYGAIYLSPTSVSLDDLVEQVGISKGAVSTNVRNLERLKMIHKRFKVGDRKDYYTAETDFWKIVKAVISEREKSEFDQALRSVGESLDILKRAKVSTKEKDNLGFYSDRLEKMKNFFDQLDSIIAVILALDELRVNSVKKFFGKS